MDEWKDIEGFEGRYQVSRSGLVRSALWRVPRGRGYVNLQPRVLKRSRDSNGYAVVNLSRTDGFGQIKCYIHRLVAIAFIGPPPFKGAQVAHWDGDGMNPAVDNLRWVTQSENERDKKRHGRANYSAKGSRTFNPRECLWLAEKVRRGDSLRLLGELFGVSHQVVSHAIREGSALR